MFAVMFATNMSCRYASYEFTPLPSSSLRAITYLQKLALHPSSKSFVFLFHRPRLCFLFPNIKALDFCGERCTAACFTMSEEEGRNGLIHGDAFCSLSHARPHPVLVDNINRAGKWRNSTERLFLWHILLLCHRHLPLYLAAY